eukprot:COSAG06_NODE_44638_length_361_cov_5.286260_1_plen_50_part_10
MILAKTGSGQAWDEAAQRSLSQINNNNVLAVYSVVLVFFVFRRIHHRGVY